MPGYEVIGAEELERVRQSFDQGRGVLFRHGFDQMRGGVFQVRDFENEFAAKLGSRHALAVTSGTAALKVALEAIGVGPGDEVITQSFTFVATVEAIIECGATPIIAEIDETLNLDPVDLERRITKRTKAVIAVHMLGTPADLGRIGAITKKHGLTLIEDTAWGLGGRYNGKMLGSIGDIGTFSFDYAKAITTGEGGMVITNNKDIDFRARAYHDHGHENNPELPRWVDSRHSSGFNYRMSELQGAVGRAQLTKLDRIIEGQRRQADAMMRVLAKFPNVKLRPSPAGSENTYDAVVFSAPTAAAALKYRESLLEEKIGTKILPEAITWHFAGTWTHMPELMAAHNGELESRFAASEAILRKCVALPVLINQPDGYVERLERAIGRVAQST